MHELSIAESILGILEAEAQRQAFRRVKKVWLEIGPLAAVEPEALRFALDAVTKGTLAEGALFEIIATQALAWCAECREAVEVRQRYEECPLCGNPRLQLRSGDEMRIKELEVE